MIVLTSTNVKEHIMDNFLQFFNILFYRFRFNTVLFYIFRFNSVRIISEAVMCGLLLNRETRTGQGKTEGQNNNNMVPIGKDRTYRTGSKKCRTRNS